MVAQIFSQMKLNNVELIEPRTIKYIDGDKEKYFSLTKSAARFIHSMIGMSVGMSEKLFKMDESVWYSLMLPKLTDRELIRDLSDYYYITKGSNVIAICNNDISQFINELDAECTEKASEGKCKSFINQNAVLQIKFTEPVCELYSSVLMIDIDLVEGYCCAFDGVEFDGRTVLMQKPFSESYKLEEFLQSFTIKSEIEMSTRLSSGIYQGYNKDYAKKILASAREVLNVIKMLKCDVELNEYGFVEQITGVDEVSQNILISFINSFDIPYKSIKKLGYLRKSLRYDDLTIDDLLVLMSKEYSNPMNNCNAYALSTLLDGYYRKESDRSVLEDEADLK